MAKKLPVFGLRAGIYKIWSKNGTTLHTDYSAPKYQFVTQNSEIKPSKAIRRLKNHFEVDRF